MKSDIIRALGCRAVNDRVLVDSVWRANRSGEFDVCWWTLSLLVNTPFAGGLSVCSWTLPLLVDTQFAGGHLSFLHSTNKIQFVALDTWRLSWWRIQAVWWTGVNTEEAGAMVCLLSTKLHGVTVKKFLNFTTINKSSNDGRRRKITRRTLSIAWWHRTHRESLEITVLNSTGVYPACDVWCLVEPDWLLLI